VKADNYKVIIRYLEGKEQKGDKELITNWLSDDDAEIDLYKINRLLWDEHVQKQEHKGFDEKKVLKNILHRIKSEESNSTPKVRRLGRKRLIGSLSIAASILLVVSIFSWMWLIKSNNTITYSTNFGEWKMVELPDGSRVKLNANSELSLAKDWEIGENRKVYLTGEAFFEVKKIPETGAKFSVICKGINIEVLGTSFNVFSRDEETEVYLEEGQVKLDHGKDIIIMDPGEFIVYSDSKGEILNRHHLNPAQPAPSDWREGVIQITKEYALPILHKLEEIYGVEIQINNEAIYEKQYTLSLPMEDLNIVIPILERSMKVEISRKNELLIID
jgi:ferric-dicitrate binding protein FerR (iron transport regulator)